MTIGNPANKWLIGVITTTLVSATGLWEGTKYYAYKDLVGVPTVCTGHTGNGIVFGRKYSAEECNAFLRTDLKSHADGILKCVTQPLKLNEFNSFTLFAYNVGVSGACSSRAIREFNLGNPEAACKALAYSAQNTPVWSYVNNGKTFVQGLHNRRLYEMRMCQDSTNG